MISSLSGKVTALEGSGVELDVCGVGYFISVPSGLLTKLSIGSEVRILTHLVVREDSMTLYGFMSTEERDVFRVLLGISGVGPKLALAILSAFEPQSLRKVVASGDVDALSSIPGIGKRGAQRLVLELKEKLGALTELVHDASTTAEVREALMSLGYSAAEVREALERIPASANGNGSVEKLVRAALQELARK